MGNAFSNASLIVTPNGYEAGTIFSLKPTDGSGDLSFTRSTKKMVRNAQGSWQEIAINMPPLHYPVVGGCPSWLFEPERTNLFLNSNAPVTQNITVSNATVYTVSVRGIGTVTLTDAATGSITGADSEGDSITVTTASTNLICTISGTSGTVYVQVEAGSTATSPIITAGASVTRGADGPNNLTITSQLQSEEWTIISKFSQNIIGNSVISLGISDGTNIEGFYLNGKGISIGGGTELYGDSLPINQYNTIALRYDGITLTWFSNGAQIGTRTKTLGTITGADLYGSYDNNIISQLVQDSLVYHSALSNTEITNIMNNL